MIRGNGHFITYNYPPLPKCPWCGAENVPRVSKWQKTCAREGCKIKQITYRKQVRKARNK